MSSEKSDITQEHIGYAVATGIFLSLFAVFNLLTRRNDKEVRPFDLALLGLSSFRLGRMVSYDKVMEPFRSPFTKTVPDPTGAGDTVIPTGTGRRRAIAELIACPICAGTWIAAGLVYALQIAPRPTRVFLSIIGAIGLGELLNSLTEMLEWGGQASREQAGSAAMAKAQSRYWPEESPGHTRQGG